MAGILLFLFIILSPSFCVAAVSLSVSPSDGSSSLKLEQAYLGLDNKKDVRVRITSTDGKRYQVFARLLEPIVNEKGISLDLGSVSLATVGSSNTAGTLYLQNEQRLGMGEQLVFSSSNAGESDGFTISFALNPKLVQVGGNFQGRMVFTVRSVDGSDSQSTLLISVQAASQWKVTALGSKVPDKVTVNDQDVTEKTSDFVKLSFSGNGSSNVRIFQEVVNMPQSADGVDLGEEGLIFYTAGQAQGLKTTTGLTLTKQRVLLYQGSDAEVSFLAYYQLNPKVLGDQAPGTYAGRIKYTVESDHGVDDLFIDLQCQVQPVFTIDVTVPGEGISFEHVLPNSPAQEKVITVSVHTNLRKPYQVSQNFQSLMTNAKGDQIHKEYFTQKVEVPVEARGRTKYADFSPVEAGEYPVYVSDSKGSPVIFRITYKLQGYQGLSAGTFNAPIQFSLNQN